jgi:chromosomal replication initiation ATPase DnaA
MNLATLPRVAMLTVALNAAQMTYGVESDLILTRTRLAHVVIARQAVVTLLWMAGMNTIEIGARLGMDRRTVSYNRLRFEDVIEVDPGQWILFRKALEIVGLK